ncbi:MAG: PAS domain S-box protein [Elusimicrobia bacterium]|nr:PAS domain S-box protein [Elusimicrobiota bacterium]
MAAASALDGDILSGALPSVGLVRLLPEDDVYRRYFLNSPDAMLVAAPSGMVLDLTPAMEILLARPAAEIMGRHTSELHPDSLRQFTAMRFAKHVYLCWRGFSLRTETLALTGSGEELPVEISTQRLEIGGTPYLQATFRDISRRRAIEGALSASVRRYRSLFNGMSEAFALHELILDRSGKPCDYRFLEANPAFERHTGIRREDVVGKTMRQTMPREEMFWLHIYSDVVLSGRPIAFEQYSRALKRHFSIFAYATGPLQFAVVFSDITRRKVAEQDLRLSEERLRVLVDSASHVFWTAGPGGSHDDMSVYRQFTGLSRKQLRGNGWLKPIHPQDRKKVLAAWNKAKREHVPYISEYRLRRFDGKYRHIMSRGAPIFDDNGKLREWAGICIDITERKTAEYDRRRFTLSMMRAREREKELLSSALHDETGSSLVALTSSLVLAEGELRSGRCEAALPKLAHARRLIKDYAGRMRSIFEEMRPPSMNISGLSGSLDNLVSNLSRAVKTEIKLLKRLPPESSMSEWTKTVAYRIVQEALTNALHHSRAKHIRVLAQSGLGRVHLSVRDDGRGFDAANPTARDRRARLGLNIMKTQAESAGGWLRVTSAPGKGTEVFADLPLTQEEMEHDY